MVDWPSLVGDPFTFTAPAYAARKPTGGVGGIVGAQRRSGRAADGEPE